MPIVTDGLTSHWDFKDGAGTTIADVVGANNGTLNGVVGSFWAKQDRNADSWRQPSFNLPRWSQSWSHGTGLACPRQSCSPPFETRSGEITG